MADERDPVQMSPGDLVSSSKLARSIGTYLDASRKRPLFITRGQEVDAVLLSLDEYRALLQEQSQLEDMLDLLRAMKRTVTFTVSGAQPLTTEQVMAELGITQSDVDSVDASELAD